MDHVKRELRNDVIEGDRRRTSMLVEGVISPRLYLGALADFLLTIVKTMEYGLRPPQPNGKQGKFIHFEEGCLCQEKTVFPGFEAKCSTGNENYSGWYAAILAVVRRLIQSKNDWTHDFATTMAKCSINFDKTDRTKAIVLMTSLKSHYTSVASNYYYNRQASPSGRIVEDYINECAAIIKRLFVKRTDERIAKALERSDDAMENHKCFDELRTERDGTVLRFCSCDGKFAPYKTSSNTFNIDVKCPINLKFAQFMLRTCRFVKEYNSVKGSRLIMADFFNTEEINLFTKHYLTSANRPNTNIGTFARGYIGILDEVFDNPQLESIR